MSYQNNLLQARYRILHELGSGGMGVVYAAEDTRLSSKRVAIKALSMAGIAPDDQAAAQQDFQKEAQMLAQLEHPGLTRVSDFFSEGNQWYLVMEYVQGETLDIAAQKQVGRLSEQVAVIWMEQLCDVLEYLHNRNPPVIFRDLKPSNIMLTVDGRIKLIDFGIARFFKPGQTQDTRNMGTPGFAAPEQYGKGQTDGRSDIYSLGVTLHTLLTDYDPAQTPFMLPAARTLNPALSPAIEQVIQRATQLNATQRFSTAREMRQRLPVQHVSSVSVSSPTPHRVVPSAKMTKTVTPVTSSETVVASPGLWLILPGLFLFFLLRWWPMLRTVWLSLQDYDVLSPAKWIGGENYVQMLTADKLNFAAMSHTLYSTIAGLVLVFGLWRVLEHNYRGGHRPPRWLAAVAAAPLAFFSPVGTSLVWRAMGVPESGPLYPLISWVSRDSALTSLILVDALHASAFAASLGIVLYAMTPQVTVLSKRATQGIGAVLLAVAAASGMQSFHWSNVITQGGPSYATWTWSLAGYTQSFMYFRLGYGASYATMLLILLIVLAYWLWRVLARSGLCLEPNLAQHNTPSVRGSGPGIVILGLMPAIILLLPLVLTVLIRFPGASLSEQSDLWLRWGLNSVLPILVVWIAQLPIAALMAYGIAGRHWNNSAMEKPMVFLLILTTLTSVSVISISLFLTTRNLYWLNTPLGLSLPSLTSGATTVIFLLFFIGVFASHGSVISLTSALKSLWPLYMVTGIAGTLTAIRAFYWPLLIANSPHIFPLEVGLLYAERSAPASLSTTQLALFPILLTGFPFALALAISVYLLAAKVRLTSS